LNPENQIAPAFEKITDDLLGLATLITVSSTNEVSTLLGKAISMSAIVAGFDNSSTRFRKARRQLRSSTPADQCRARISFGNRRYMFGFAKTGAVRANR
jgi:hypothetical protein